MLPKAYEKALIEVSRRRKFRKIVEEQHNKLSEFISKEREKRLKFMNEYGKIIPSDFITQLREVVPTIQLDGGLKD